MLGMHIRPSSRRRWELLTFIGLLCTEQGKKKKKFRLCVKKYFGNRFRPASQMHWHSREVSLFNVHFEIHDLGLSG